MEKRKVDSGELLAYINNCNDYQKNKPIYCVSKESTNYYFQRQGLYLFCIDLMDKNEELFRLDIPQNNRFKNYREDAQWDGLTDSEVEEIIRWARYEIFEVC